MGDIINFKPNKYADKNRFDKILNQESCQHVQGFTFDEEYNEVECDSCEKKFTSNEFLVWWTKERSPENKIRIEFYSLKNKHWHYTELLKDLEEKISYLKKEKTTLTREVNKLRKL